MTVVNRVAGAHRTLSVLSDDERAALQRERDYPTADGIPMDSHGHVRNLSLLVDAYNRAQGEPHRDFISGNIFVHYNPQIRGLRKFRGPDVLVVRDVPQRDRDAWVAWEEEGRLPNVVIELLSKSTRTFDLGGKKRIYEQEMRIPEYFWFDQKPGRVGGFRLVNGVYQEIAADAQGRYYSAELDLYLVSWLGEYDKERNRWLRWAARDGTLLPTREEGERQERGRADAERARAESAEARAESAEARAETAETRAQDLARRNAELEARLRTLGVDLPNGAA
jgi:Uma2 family endonuclease